MRIRVLLLSSIVVPALVVGLAVGFSIDRPRTPTPKRQSPANFDKPSNNNARQSSPAASNWYQRRKSNTIRPSVRRTKPPKWEKEGDDLYQEIIISSNSSHEKISYDQARALLQNITVFYQEKADIIKKKSPERSTATTNISTNSTAGVEPPFLWGGLSVGPVWKQRLIQAGFTLPTSIQQDAYTIMTRNNTQQNVILASPTGSGKSLAFLLPLLTFHEKRPGMVWIVTPTTELAHQLQNVVQTLSANTNGNSPEICQVLEYQPMASQDQDNTEEELPISVGEAPFLIGTPKVFLQLAKELVGHRRSALLNNLHTIVLDEADRLLQTEAIARQEQWRKEGSAKTAKRRPRLEPTATEQLLQRLLGRVRNNPRATNTIRLVCASATVGRTLRRQVMQLVNAPSMDAAAVLVTDKIRTKKDAQKRKAQLLPNSLQHYYHVLQRKEEILEEASTLIASLPPAPMLIFPGRTGVKAVQEHLRNCDSNIEMKCVGGLEDIVPSTTQSAPLHYTSWKDAPVYVVSEKLGRGLDIPGLRYVLLLQVPSSAAGYTHLTGRTGRNGSPGTAICVTAPQQAPKLGIIAETLGLELQAVKVDAEGTATTTSTNSGMGLVKKPIEVAESFPTCAPENKSWTTLSPSALKRKTIPEIKEYLTDNDVDLATPKKKAELLKMVDQLHSP